MWAYTNEIIRLAYIIPILIGKPLLVLFSRTRTNAVKRLGCYDSGVSIPLKTMGKIMFSNSVLE